MSKKLSIGTIKKELMDAMVNNVNIINSFGKHEDIKKTSDYINRNIFSNLNIDESFTSEASYISFDVSYERKSYGITIIVRVYRGLRDNNRVDVICDAITDIVNELYPYHTSFINMPIRNDRNYIERQIHFLVAQDDADKYAEALKAEEDPIEAMGEWIDRVSNCIEKFEKFYNSKNTIIVNCDGTITISGDNIKILSSNNRGENDE